MISLYQSAIERKDSQGNRKPAVSMPTCRLAPCHWHTGPLLLHT